MAEIDNDVTADVMDVAPEEAIRVCLFSIGEETYAIPVSLLTEIIIPQKIYPVPTTPPHFLGVINLRGSIVPIVDIRSVLSLPQRSAPGQIVIIKQQHMLLGIVVDNVSEVLSMPESSLLELPPAHGLQQAEKGQGRFIKTVIQRETGVVALLDIERIIDEIALK